MPTKPTLITESAARAQRLTATLAGPQWRQFRDAGGDIFTCGGNSRVNTMSPRMRLAAMAAGVPLVSIYADGARNDDGPDGGPEDPGEQLVISGNCAYYERLLP